MDVMFTVEIVIAAVITIWIMRTVFIFRNKISSSAGMMTAMSMGMLIGLLGGTIVGVINPGGLFPSTIMGVLIGLVGGYITGLPFTTMAVLDGGLSGMMGGMMGVMLGDMVASNQGALLLEYMFWMFICFTLILIYLLYDVTMLKLPVLVRNPLLLTIILALFFVVIEQFNIPKEVSHKEQIVSPHTKHEEEIDALNVGEGIALIDNKTKVIATDFSYSPNILQIEAGKPFTLIMNNEGDVEHDLELTTPEGSVIHIHALPGEETQEQLNLPIGTYQFVCTLPGHKEAGMIGSIVVT